MAKVEYFLEIDGIEGESKDENHKGEIEILSWSWGEKNKGSSTSGGGGAGKVQAEDFRFAMTINRASPKLLLACATGEHIRKAVLAGRKAGKEQQTFVVLTLSDIQVTSFETNTVDEDTVFPIDQVSLAFSKIEYEYRIQKSDGSPESIKVGFDLKSNHSA